MRVRAEKLRSLDADRPIAKSSTFSAAGDNPNVLGHGLILKRRHVYRHPRPIYWRVVTLNAPPRFPGERLLACDEHYIIDINLAQRVREA